MQIVGIDPGLTKSALAVVHPHLMEICEHVILPNEEVYGWLKVMLPSSEVVIGVEVPASYGMPVGKDVFDTCIWVGRFLETFHRCGWGYHRVLRKGRWGPGPDDTGAQCCYDGVCMTLCKSTRAKDSNVRKAVLDFFRERCPNPIGTKKNPGVLYGVSRDMWSAYAVALTVGLNLELFRCPSPTAGKTGLFD